MLRVLYFGRLFDITQRAEETVQVGDDVRTTQDLLTWLVPRFEGGEALREPTIRMAVNSEIITGAHALQPGDEVAFLPPVGGG